MGEIGPLSPARQRRRRQGPFFTFFSGGRADPVPEGGVGNGGAGPCPLTNRWGPAMLKIEHMFYFWTRKIPWNGGLLRERSLGKQKIPPTQSIWIGGMVEEDGFEPSKSSTTDLQSAPFGHSGTPPYEIGAGGRTRTPDLLITNQLLYQLSYTSTGTCSSAAKISLSDGKRFVKHFFKKGGLFCHKAVWEGERRQWGRFPSGTGSRRPPAFSAPSAARNNIPMTRRRWQGCAPNAAGGTDNERRML